MKNLLQNPSYCVYFTIEVTIKIVKCIITGCVQYENMRMWDKAGFAVKLNFRLNWPFNTHAIRLISHPLCSGCDKGEEMSSISSSSIFLLLWQTWLLFVKLCTRHVSCFVSDILHYWVSCLCSVVSFCVGQCRV